MLMMVDKGWNKIKTDSVLVLAVTVRILLPKVYLEGIMKVPMVYSEVSGPIYVNLK